MMRTTIWFYVIFFVIMTCHLIAFVTFASSLGRIVNVAVLSIVMTILVGGLVQRRHTVRNLVETQRGLICPRCLFVLSAGEDGVCPECGKAFTTKGLRDYWDRTFATKIRIVRFRPK